MGVSEGCFFREFDGGIQLLMNLQPPSRAFQRKSRRFKAHLSQYVATLLSLFYGQLIGGNRQHRIFSGDIGQSGGRNREYRQDGGHQKLGCADGNGHSGKPFCFFPKEPSVLEGKRIMTIRKELATLVHPCRDLRSWDLGSGDGLQPGKVQKNQKNTK